MKINAARPKSFFKLLLPIFIGFLVSLVGQSTVAPPASAAIYGTIYNVTPKLSGGSNYGEANCAADQVVVGLLMGWNPMSVGFKCNALNSDLTISPIASKTANYAYCPDGMVAVGMAFISSDGTRAGLICNTPPGLSGSDVETKYVSVNNSPVLIDKPTDQAYAGGGVMRCNAGDIMVGWRVWSGAWLDGLAPRCAPFTKFTVTYNVNSGGGTAPTTQQQSGPNASITISTYTGTRSGFRLSGWNTQANGLGTDYAAGATITPTDNLVLYAKWLSTITYNGNGNTSGSVPLSTIAQSSAAVTQLSPNNGSSAPQKVPLAKTGFTFAGWNTQADGKGTSYTGYGYSEPVMRFRASDYDASTKIWSNSASTGATYDVSSTGMGAGTGITKATTSANVNGNTTTFTTLSGLTTSRVTFPNTILNSYTLCHVSRYASTTTSRQQRIIGHASYNWLSGNLSGKTGSYYGSGNFGNGYTDSNSGATTNGALNDTDWHLYCDYSGGFRMDGTAAVAAGRQTLPANISINTFSNQQSEWEIAEVLIFDRALDASGIKYIESQLATTYGLSGYASGTGTYASTGDITLYAQWNSTITYDGNGQTSASSTVPGPTTAVGTGSNTTLAAPTTLLRTNFTFDGWNTAADGSGTSYASGLTTYASTGSRTLYAQWKAAISFNGNTNTGGTAPTTVNATRSTITLPADAGTLVKTGYAFAGWNTATDGSGTAYASGAAYTVTGNATLYAVWTLSNAGLNPSFKTDTSSLIGVLANTSYVINNVYSGTTNDLILSDYADKIQIIATVSSGTLAITTTTNLTAVPAYQIGLSGAAGTISFVGNLADVNAALASLKYTAAATPVSTTIYIYASYAGANGEYQYNPTTGSSYYRPLVNQTWNTAFNQTTASSNCGVSFNGMCGYLAVPNDLAETQWIANKVGQGWIGIKNTAQGVRQFVTNAPNPSSTVTFINYASNSPKNTASAVSRIAYSSGEWIEDLANSTTATPVFEFGGKSETPIFAALTRTITIGALVAPNAPTLDVASDSGTSNSDKITNDNTPTINIGGLTVGATVTLTASPASGTAVTCTFVATTTSGSCTFSTMPDGTYSIVATQTLGGTTTAGSAALANVQIDTVRPTVTLTATVGAGTNVASGANDTIARNAAINVYTIKATFSESVSGLLISEITQDAASTGWSVGGTLTGSGASYTFTATNSGVVVNTVGKLLLRIAEGVAGDAAGNTNTATTSDFVINSVARVDFWDCGPLGQYCTGGAGPASLTQASSGASITLPGANTLYKTGYSFAGWGETQNAGTVLTGSYTPSTRIILFPQWTPDVYVVTYNANGGNGAPTTASQNFTYGSTALSPSAKGTLTRTGYTFAGWSTTAIASGTIYSNSSDNIAGTTTAYTPTASITLYAKWTANTYAVTFDSNSGTGTQMTNLSITAGTATPLTANSYSRTGYTFGGWNTLANGSGTSYANSASVTLFANTTIYAQWVPVKPGVPTVAISGSAGNTQITVSVTGATLSSTSGPATTYTVTSSPGSLTCTITSPATTCTFTGLTNGQAYTFTAVATNATGSSTSSVASSSATPVPYVVTYSLNGGTLSPNTANYNLGTPLTLPLPTKTGYTFGGWYGEVGLTTLVGNDGASYSPSAATTLYAKWTGNTYSITYFGNGSDTGTVTSAATFIFGNSYSIALKGTMAKSGYTFAGWTPAANGTGTLYANGTDSIASSTATYSAAANLNLYAKWTPQVYVITYNANNASGSPSRATDSFTFGTTAISLPDKTGMTYAGYTFGGWSESANGAAVVNPYSPTQTRTLYALWTGVQYSVSYNVNGGTGSVADATYTTGTTGITLNNGSTLSRTGYTFGGWKNLAGTTVSGSAYVATDNVTLYAIWSPNTIAVSFSAGLVAGAAPTTTLPATTSAQFGTLYTLPAALANVSDSGSPVSNYAFAGWAFNGSIYQAGSTYRMTTSAPTFTAQWQKILAVAYILNGGTLASGDQLYDLDCTFEPVGHQCGLNNLVITLNKVPSRLGFNFAGWSSQGTPATLIPAETSYTLNDSNYIFYANWTANSYTITFAAGTGSNGNAAAITDSYGSIVQLAASTGYSFTGSVFTGWLIGATTYPAGAFYTMGTDASPITATAQFANNTFKVFYNTNGATVGSTPSATAAVQGANITLDGATGFSRPGFTFDGWSDGTNVRVASYATTMGSTNSTVIAQWKVAIPLTPTISSVSGSDGGATITVAPDANGGAPTSYVVTASPGGATCTVYAPATSCSISPLTNGTSYTFSVTATNSTGTSAAATSAAVTPAGKPDAPTGVNAVSGNGSATVSFVAPTNTGGPAIASYTVTASPDGATCTVSAPATSCVVPGLTNGTAYTFTVTANNGLFTSSASTASSSVVPSTVPNAPTSVTATSSTSGSATVSFTAPVNNGGSAVTGYTVTSSPAGATCSIGANATTYVCTGLTNGTSYTYSVIATNIKGNSVSATSSALITQGAASAPTTISATVGDGQATVTFSGAVANGSTITGYTVKAYDNTGNEVTGVSCTVTTASTGGNCIVTGLTNGSSYTFKAITNSTANSTAVTSGPSIATTAITPAKAPDAPTGVQVSAGTGKVTVSWTAPSSNGSPITSYTVQAYDEAGNAVSGATCTATAPATTCDVSTNLTAGTNYTFKVTATSGAGTSSASSASSSVAINAAPSVPRNVVATAGNGSVAVTWDAPSDTRGSALTGYTATAYTSGNNVVGTCTSTVIAEACTVTGLTNGTAYTFKVVATNGIGTSAASDPSAAVTPSTVPNAPTGVTAAMGDASASVSFLAPANNGGSAVLRYTVTSSPGNFTCTVNAPATSCNVTGLTNGTAYTFTVKATNKNGDSVASTASSAGTPVLSSPPTVANDAQPTGNPYVGSTLTSAVTFNGSPTPTITYQWKVCTDPTNILACTNISGATSASYTPTLSELGKYIVVDATANNGVGTPVTETSNPTQIINPEIAFSAPSPVPGATAGTAYVLSAAAAGGVGTFTYTVASGTLPPGVTLDPATGQIAGTPTTAGTYTFTVRATDSNGVYKDVVITIVVAAAVTQPVTNPTTPTEPQPRVPTCDADCQAAKEAAATKAAADKAAADAIAKAAADKAAADAAVAAKAASDTAATTASTKAAADAAAAAAAAKAAVDKAAAAAVAQAAADAAAKTAAAQAKAAADAQAAAVKAAADAAAALKNSTATAAAKAAATKSANDAAAAATAAVKAAATAASDAAKAKTTATNATKQVDIAINSLNSKTAVSQASAQANAIAAAAKAAANEAAAAAATKAAEAKTTATAAQKAASDTAARIATEQKQAADAAALAKIAADAAVKATAEKVAAVAAATKASQELATVLAQKATLAEQAAKATDQTARAEIQKKIDEVSTKVEEVQKSVEAATTKADAAVAVQETAVQTAETATKEATTQAAEAVAVKAESVTKTAEATKAVAAATVAAKVATAAKEAAAKVPSKAVITTKPSTSTSKNSATATITGLKPGQSVKVTVNTKDK